jgi:ribosome recycling factor
MIEEALEELESAIEKAHVALKRDLARLRTGRAHPSLLDSLRVDFYGTPTPIAQMATVNVPEARLLTIKPWDKSQVRPIEKAIMESDLGLNPQTDGDLIRLPLPVLTEERRRDLLKVAKKHGEECKVVIRKARHVAKDFLSAMESDGEASADDVERAQKKVEEIVQRGTAEVDAIVSRREKDILEV